MAFTTEQQQKLDAWAIAEKEKERLRRVFRHELDAEERAPLEAPDVATLRARLARPRTETAWRIARWQPAHSRTMLSAQFKAGKTTLVGNLLRSLVDGDPFLSRDVVTPVKGCVALLDFEMGQTQLDDWLRAQRIRGDDRVLIIPLRGMASAFDITLPDVRAQWVARFKQAQVGYLAVDCLRPILDAIGLDEHHEAGKFLVHFDTLLREAHIPDALVVQHMGHTGERARGDSRLRDWPDVEWRLVREDEDDPSSARYLTAYGRDVNVDESKLEYDDATRRLTIAGGSRRDAKADKALHDVRAVLRKADKALSGRAIEAELAETDHSRATSRRALRVATRNGEVVTESGARGARLHRLPPLPGDDPDDVPPLGDRYPTLPLGDM
ncbi:MAG: AAA family ATPase [Vicinamibacterales bacterium]